MQEILTIQAEVETTNPIQIADVCDAVIWEMERLKRHCLDDFPDDHLGLKTGNLEGPEGELFGDWAVEPRKKGRR